MGDQLVVRDRAEITTGPRWAELVDLATDGKAEATRRGYASDLAAFFTWHEAQGAPPITKAVVNAWAASMLEAGRKATTVQRHLCAVRALVREAADNGLLSRDVAEAVARVKGPRSSGDRLGLWLTRDQAQALLDAPDVTTRGGLRDRALLAVMVGAGLRRSEVAALEVAHVQQRDGRWVIADLVGKGGRVRTVPIPSWAYVAIRAWLDAAGVDEGRIFRPVNKGDRIAGESMTASAVWHRVRAYADRMAAADPSGPWAALAPHDLRRTYAHLARRGGSEIEQIQLSLGHASVATTERYLGTRQDFHDAPCDRLGLTVAA